MDKISVRETDWRGMDAWWLSAAELELCVTATGANIAAIRTPDDKLNPLWQPSWEATTPGEGERHPELYGPMPETPLLAVIVGHNICLDRFGAPWPGENTTVHGEAPVASWSLQQKDDRTVDLSASLPEAGLELSRSFRIDKDELEVTTTVKPETGKAQEIEWAEHVTIGDPFLDGAEFTAAVDGAWIADLEPVETRRFPDVPGWSEVKTERALAMPKAAETRALGDIVTMRATEGWFRARRADLGRQLEYRWNADDFPWLCVWTQHRSRTAAPWNGQERARGIEFSSKPFPEGKPPQERYPEYQSRPTTCHVPGEGITRTFTVRWSAV